MDNFLEQYMVGEKPQVIEHKMIGMSIIDVKWSYEFNGGKPERLKVINHLKKLGYKTRGSLYVK